MADADTPKPVVDADTPTPTEDKPPPSFERSDYWDGRYTSTDVSYDWLRSASVLDADITASLATLPENPPPRILHVGCGTSELSFHLRRYVRDPRQIQNVDFSPAAIAWGHAKEKELFGFELETVEDSGAEEEDGWVDEPRSAQRTSLPQFQMPMSYWTLTDLLDLGSVISTCSLGAYGLVVDKTCCDNIACASVVSVFLPYFLYLGASGKAAKQDPPPFVSPSALPTPPSSTEPEHEAEKESTEHEVYPIHIYAIHLALLTPPGARWVAFSYSKDRFFFLEPMTEPPRLSAGGIDKSIPKDLIDKGFPDSSKLWKMVKKAKVGLGSVERSETGSEIDAPSLANDEVEVSIEDPNQPSDCYWVYVLERTDVELRVRGT